MANDRMRIRSFTITAACVLAVGVAGCGDDDTIVCPTEEPVAPVIPEPTSPENLVEAIAVIYSDTVRGAVERVDAYEQLFPPPNHPSLPGFIFRLQPDDVVAGLPESWGLDQELAIHERMFGAQDAREIFELSVSIEHLPSEPLELPEPGQEDWRSVFATNCHVRLLFNRDDGIEVGGGRGRFIAAPDDHRWYLVEWVDLPRAAGVLPTVIEIDASTWGSIKAIYR